MFIFDFNLNMKLPLFKKIQKFIHPKEIAEEYFLILEIKEGFLKSVLYKNSNNQNEIIGSSIERISQDWDEIINVADQSIAKISDNITDEKIKNTIFGLPSYWIEEGNIKPEILAHLKNLCKKLELVPLGFIVITEALLAQIQKKEEAPLTCILIEIGNLYNIISLILIGKIQTSTYLDGQSGRLCDQIVEILKKFSSRDVLPSRILLYDEDVDLDKIKQEIISYPWNQKASFLHFPKVEILPRDYDLDGIILTSSKEIKNRFSSSEDTQTTVDSNLSSPVFISSPKNSEVDKTSSPSSFGFIEDKDILELENLPLNSSQTSSENTSYKKDNPPVFLNATTLVTENTIESKAKEAVLISPPPEISQEIPLTPQVISSTKLDNQGMINENLPPKPFFPKKINILSPALNFFKFFRQSLLIGFILLLFLLGITAFAYYNFFQVKISLFVEPETFEKETEIIIKSEKEKANFEKKEIQGVFLNTEVQEKITQKTTGEKIIGEKAKGEVILYNKNTTGSKTFKAGTILISSENKEYLLDNDTTIPAAFSQTEGITFGKTKASVTAIEIGEEYNLPSGKKEFSIKEFPTTSYSALSETPFTGGSSRKIKVVSKKDSEEIKSVFLKKTETLARKKFQELAGEKRELVLNSLEIVSQKLSLQPEVGEEAQELTLSGKVNYKILAFAKDDILSILDKEISKSLKGYEYQKEKIKIEIKNIKTIKEKEKTINLIEVGYSLKLMPKYDLLKIKKDLSGKNLNLVRNYLNRLPNIVDFVLQFSPELPKPFLHFPYKTQNIIISIYPKE